MTLIEYLRFRIPDKDFTNYIFTDEELDQFIKMHSAICRVVPTKLDKEGKIYSLHHKVLDETYPIRVWADNVEVSDFTVDYLAGVITFTEPKLGSRIEAQIKLVDWDNVLADCYETIMGDYKKLNSYSIQNAQQSYDDLKYHLRYLANYYRPGRGHEL